MKPTIRTCLKEGSRSSLPHHRDFAVISASNVAARTLHGFARSNSDACDGARSRARRKQYEKMRNVAHIRLFDLMIEPKQQIGTHGSLTSCKQYFVDAAPGTRVMGDSSRHALLGLFRKGLKNDHEGVYRYLASISGTVNLACDLRYIHTFHRYKRRQACAHMPLLCHVYTIGDICLYA